MTDGRAPAPSVLAPAGVEADALAEVAAVLLGGGALLFVATLLLLALALRRSRRRVHGGWWVFGGGVALPVVVLTALLAYATQRTRGLEQPPAAAPLVVGLTAHQWWWEVRYTDAATGRSVTGANELRLPAGRPARIGLESADVIHSVWVPALGGKMDLVPGRVNHLTMTPHEPGAHRGQCAEYCGGPHARMALHVVVLPPDEFAHWLEREARPAPAPAGALEARGRAAFVEHGCTACHARRGVADGGGRGPDLTHVAGRLYLAAGTLPNDAASLARWIADVQAVKPGARMPSYGHLDAATLDALAAFLAQPR
jgi:cytochrome c oxidase subunit 2